MGILADFKTLFRTKNKSTNVSVSTQKKILVVEDEPALADSLEIRLNQEGYSVLKAENGKVGLDLAIKEKPDLIILDLMMPLMDGNSMLRSLRKIPSFSRLPVIVLTNKGTVDNIRDTMVYEGAIEFLIKSNVSLNTIVSRIKTHIGN